MVAVSYGVQNDVDTGIQGNIWAFDTYTRTVRVWRKAPGRFCSISSYHGTFSSVAGARPGGQTQLRGWGEDGDGRTRSKFIDDQDVEGHLYRTGPTTSGDFASS